MVHKSKQVVNETKKILHLAPETPISCTAARVPVFNGHSESINVEFEKDFILQDIFEIYKNARGIVLQDNVSENVYPMAITANGYDEVFVGRIRRDYSVRSGLNLWVVADNLRKGAASNAVQIMEEMMNKIQNQVNNNHI